MRSLKELNKLKEEALKEIKLRNTDKKATIIIGMGTCGIAAGARDILQSVHKEIDKRGLDVRVTQTGCIGMCEKEPLMDVQLPEEERITYGNLNQDDIRKIIVEHVINGNVVREKAIARFTAQ